MGGEDEGGDHTEVEGEGERKDRLDRVQLQHRHPLVVRQGHLCTVHIIVGISDADPGSDVNFWPWKKFASGVRTKNPESHFLELTNNLQFLGCKILKFFVLRIRIRDGKFRIQDPR